MAEPIVYHKICKDPRCRKPFDTTSRNQGFCCPDCQKRYYDERKKRRVKYEKTKEENTIASAAYRLSGLVAEYFKPEHVCEYCGAESTHVHHINLNILDNRPENLARMCEKCHKKLHSKLPNINMIDIMSSVKGTEVSLSKVFEARFDGADPVALFEEFKVNGFGEELVEEIENE